MQSPHRMGGRSSSRSIEGRSGQPIGGRSVANPVEERKWLCELVTRDIVVERYLGKENWKSYTYRQQDVKPWIEPTASNRRVSRATARRPVCLLSPHARRPKKTEEDRRRPKKTEEDRRRPPPGCAEPERHGGGRGGRPRRGARAGQAEQARRQVRPLPLWHVAACGRAVWFRPCG
jgi:hypothetical protein